jgi:hypothetical protein
VESEEALVPLAAHLDVRFISTDGNLEVVLEGEDAEGALAAQQRFANARESRHLRGGVRDLLGANFAG